MQFPDVVLDTRVSVLLLKVHHLLVVLLLVVLLILELLVLLNYLLKEFFVATKGHSSKLVIVPLLLEDFLASESNPS